MFVPIILLLYLGVRNATLAPFFIPMLTVYSKVSEYCKNYLLPFPEQKELAAIGRMVSHHFKNYFVPTNEIPPGSILPEVGFLIQDEYGKRIVATYYPADFEQDIEATIVKYFTEKTREKIHQPPPPEPKKRKRIPLSPENKVSDGPRLERSVKRTL